MSDADRRRVVRKRRISAALLQCSPTRVRCLLLAHYSVAVSGAGDHPSLKAPTAAPAALHAVGGSVDCNSVLPALSGSRIVDVVAVLDGHLGTVVGRLSVAAFT